MCAILGYSTPEKPDLELIRKLLRESKIRGLHAFGYAFFREGLQVKKFHDLDEAYRSLCEDAPRAFMAHCRYSTSGDYVDHRNNQPIVSRDGRALVFNGVLHMGTKWEMEEEFKVSMDTENDGELALLLGMEQLVRTTTGSFAGILAEGGRFKVVRNARRPATLFRRGEEIVVTSTADIGLRAGLTQFRRIAPFEVLEFG